MGGQEGKTVGAAFCAQELLLRAECCNVALDQIVVRGCENVPGRTDNASPSNPFRRSPPHPLCERGFEAVAKMEQVDTQKVENSLSQFVEVGVSAVREALKALMGLMGQSWQEILAESDGAFIKMILLECTELPHYAARLRRVSGLPVLDLVTCANFFAKVLVGSF